ncbi:uncharacterized protein LOC122088220 [Macadamia integrifolia]|uniref:uncharacterized protein LOC122088220 n=1 Tax=Macadamia integrifolia TaxID=60698 RepID=UPI001C4FD60A|nr:uncharacterized protein LOC122088220 [Macadamia integrifolia]
MKASIKFREEEKPLSRAKVPLSILGFPFQSGITAGDSKELCLNLSTFFQSGPSFKIAYRPNDSWNPFSLIVKTGIGHFGSPISAHMTMSAEFNLISRGNPSFFLQFKPQIGDFSIIKSHRSPIGKVKSNARKIDSDDEASVDGGERTLQNGVDEPTGNYIFRGKEINGLSPENNAVRGICNLFSGMELNARTVLPIRDRAVLKFRWGVSEAFVENKITESSSRNSLWKIPLLVMRKITVEQVVHEEGSKEKEKEKKKTFTGDADVSDVCLAVKRQLEVMQAENSSLRRVVEEFRSDVRGGKPVSTAGNRDSGNYRETERNGGKFPVGRKERRNDERKSESEFGGPAAGKTMEGDVIVNDELKA